jgi:arylsulfatase A-like enzyme
MAAHAQRVGPQRNKASKGTIHEGGFRVPAIIRWPGHVKPATVENEIFSGMDWYPTFVAAAGNPNITEQLLKGVKLGDQTYKNHLDGYNQMALLEGKGPSARREIFYFGGAELGASGTEKQLESHRRKITALFCDLRGFTGFSESSDPEDVMALLRE